MPRNRLLPAVAVLGALLGLTAVVDAPGAAAVGNPPHSGYVNVPADDFPDPVILREGTSFYAFGTDGDLGNVQAIQSGDLVTWSRAGSGSALPTAPSWAQNDDIWAPGIWKAGSTYVLYSSVVHRTSGKRCISAATSTSPTATFTANQSFMHCNDGEGGVIDPDVFQTVGGTYLLWKTEGVPGRSAPAIWIQPLAANGLSLTGAPTKIFQSQYPWEGTLVENPTMVADGGNLYLFYSGNEWESAAYGVGWARCASVTGPCVAPPNKPLLTTESNELRGPGGGTVFQDETGAWWLGYAAWIDQNVTEETGHRKLFFRRLQFQDGRPVLQAANGSYPAQPLAVRIAGGTRYETAAQFSANLVQPARPIAYVARGDDFADALASGPASGFEGGPVLLVQPGGVPASVKSELCRVRPGHIVVMGGTNAVSQAVYNDLATCSQGGSSIHREAGVNRYHTAALVSRNTYDPGVGVVYVATGENFADALAGGAAGARNKGPLLLVQRDGIPVDTGVELDRLNPQRIVVLGGASAVSENVAGQLGRYGPVSRIAGNTRYDTASRVARQEFGTLVGGVVIATGQVYADAVAAGAAGYPIILVPSGGAAPAESKAALDALEPLGVLVLGGQGAVPDATLASLGL